MKRSIVVASLALAIVLSAAVLATAGAQSTTSTDVDIRVWQRVTNDATLAISVRPEGRAWADLGTVALEMSGLSDSRRHRYGDIMADGLEVRVWQRLSNLRSLYISARPLGGSWADLGAIPLEMNGLSGSGRYRYGDVTLTTLAATGPNVVSVSAGKTHTCALFESGRLVCWGEPGFGETNVPAGTYRSVSAGHARGTCAVRMSGALACWGLGTTALVGGVPEGSYRSVSVGFGFACAVSESGAVDCWGQQSPALFDIPSGTYRAVSAASVHACALRESGQIACWGLNGSGQTDAPAGTYRAVSAGGDHTCALGHTGTVTCWGANEYGQTDVPEGRYQSVSVGRYHTCALDEAGAAVCWGGSQGHATEAPSGEYRFIDSGDSYSCGIREVGGIECWGGILQDFGQRKGLGIALGEPRYVTAIDAATNVVVVGDEDDLYADHASVEALSWVAGAPPTLGEPIAAKARYKAEAAPATLVDAPGDFATVRFERRQRALTAGQAIALYRGEEVLGGGTIARAWRGEGRG